ncbi:MAG: serine--tRNA ligase [Spirochaetes bacterium]|nr:serine--tRNA ligase [Spirochaetota bacterium]
MLDIKFIKENLQLVKDNVKKRFTDADPNLAVELYDKKNQIQVELDNIRQKRNINADKMKQKMDQEQRNILIEEGKELKNKISDLEANLYEISDKFSEELSKIPNLTHPSTPIGKTEEDSKIIKNIGQIPSFSFKIKDHIEIAKDLDIIDFENAAKVSGQKFYYLKNEGALLELALINFAMKMLTEKGFVPYITPDLAREKILSGIGFNPRGNETNIYSVKDSDLCLIATAEITLGGLYMDKIIPADQLPIKMVGLSHCFRTEAGAAGKAQKGLYRVHQFSKVEMFVITSEEDSREMHEELREIEEDIFKQLKIPFRLLDIASGDLGAPAYKKYDLEAWMPGKNEYGEITSTSNCTDYQSRRLNIKYKDSNGSNKYAYMLNGTAVAVPRAIISILENFQREDGSVLIPKVLIPFMGVSEIKKK